MADTRSLTNTPATLTARFYDGEAPADPGVVTVTVTASDGTVVAEDAATAGTGADARTYALAAQESPELFTATWTAAARSVVTHHEVVGGYVCELVDIRAQRSLADTTKFPTALLEAARWWFEDLAEEFCGLSFTRRLRVDTVDGGVNVLRLPRDEVVRVAWATADGDPLDVTDWAGQPYGAVYAPSAPAWGRSNVTVGYEHGMATVPADVRRAALTAIRARLLTDEAAGIPDRATSMTNEYGTTSFVAQPGQRRATGWPEVDAVLSRYRAPVVA